MKDIFIGKENFAELIRTNSYYVDKTKMIEDILDNRASVFLFPRPRRFGKTLTMSMLENFFNVEKKEDNKDLFKGLYIENSKYYEKRNTRPVISVTFKELKQTNFDDLLNSFIEIISRLYSTKTYLYDVLDTVEKEKFDSIRRGTANKIQYQNAFLDLSVYLERYHHQKVIILIDEYDVPIQQGYLQGYYDEVIDFIRSMFSAALKTNDSVDFAIMTGVLRVSKESIFSDLNNVKVYGIYNSSFTEYFGFTEEETKTLLKYYGLELNEDVKNMYDGYVFNEVNIYNPWSITNYAKDKLMGTYWINTSSNDLIKIILERTTDQNKVVIEKLLQGESCLFDYNEKLTYKDFDRYDDLNNILNLMFSSGYLTVDKITHDEFGEAIYVRFPNAEVKKLIAKIMAETIYGENNYTDMRKLTDAISNCDLVNLEEILNKLLQSRSYMDYEECSYHEFMLGIFVQYLNNKNFIVKSNREAGSGRYDVMIERVDRTSGYIFEFKITGKDEDMEEKAKKALSQIKEKEYYKELELDRVKDIKCLAIVFKEKKCIVRSM